MKILLVLSVLGLSAMNSLACPGITEIPSSPGEHKKKDGYSDRSLTD